MLPGSPGEFYEWFLGHGIAAMSSPSSPIVAISVFAPGLSEDPGPHDVIFPWVRRAERGGISRVTVVVVGPNKYKKRIKCWFYGGSVKGFEQSGVRTPRKYVYGAPGTLSGAP